MGASYSVHFKIEINKGCEDKLFKELKDIIGIGDEKASEQFHLDKVKQNGNNLETYLDLLKVIFSSYSEPAKDITVKRNGLLCYDNDFDADYGWLGVMEFAIRDIAFYLDDYSYFYISTDSDSAIFVAYAGNIIKLIPRYDSIKSNKKISGDNKSEVKSDDRKEK